MPPPSILSRASQPVDNLSTYFLYCISCIPVMKLVFSISQAFSMIFSSFCSLMPLTASNSLRVACRIPLTVTNPAFFSFSMSACQTQSSFSSELYANQSQSKSSSSSFISSFNSSSSAYFYLCFYCCFILYFFCIFLYFIINFVFLVYFIINFEFLFYFIINF